MMTKSQQQHPKLYNCTQEERVLVDLLATGRSTRPSLLTLVSSLRSGNLSMVYLLNAANSSPATAANSSTATAANISTG